MKPESVMPAWEKYAIDTFLWTHAMLHVGEAIAIANFLMQVL